ncbi:MAG: metallophosphoesterase [Pseudomonadota bacterium]
MRILILSDLHDDFWADYRRDPFKGIEDEIADLDLLLLAGDISNKPKVRWRYAFERLSRLMPLERVAVFPGNHDFYDFEIDGEERLQEIASSLGVSYVQKKQIALPGIRLLCATLWTDFELGPGSAINKGRIVARMNDYRKIRVASDGYRRLSPSDLIARHRDHLSWFDDELSRPFDGRTFVVTHHAPHQSVLQDYSEGLDAAYASDLGAFIQTHKPDRWFFGHSHGAKDVSLGKTELRNVSLGYPDDVPDPGHRITSLIFKI